MKSSIDVHSMVRISTIVFVILMKGIFSLQDIVIVFIWIIPAVNVFADKWVVSQERIFFIILFSMRSTSLGLLVTFLRMLLIFFILLVALLSLRFMIIDISNYVG